MLDTLQAQIGAGITFLVIAYAFLKGDEPERFGAAAFALAWFISLLIQGDTTGGGLSWGLPVTDLALLGVYVALAWRSRRTWPIWASCLQSLIVMTTLLPLIDVRPPLLAFYVVINLASYGILLTLALGTFAAWREHRAVGVE